MASNQEWQLAEEQIARQSSILPFAIGNPAIGDSDLQIRKLNPSIGKATNLTIRLDSFKPSSPVILVAFGTTVALVVLGNG